MSDESLDDIIADLDRTIAEGPAEREKDGDEGGKDVESTSKTVTADDRRTGAPSTGGPRRRLVGLLATLLGVLGCLLALVSAFFAVRLLFGADDAIGRMMEPIDVAIERLEGRIDETDDLLGEPDRVGELQARVDGLVDITTGAGQGINRLQEHPLYGRLPASTDGLQTALDDFASGAAEVDDRLGSAADGDELPPADANAIRTTVNNMQASVTDARTLADDTESSLAGWTRLAALAGFIGSLWGLWAQFCLARRGLRGLRGRAV